MEIVFNKLSANDISKLDTLEQLELLKEFKVSKNDLKKVDGDKFGKITRGGKTLFRYRAKDWRIYFIPAKGENVVIHRVLHKNTFKDFLFRSSMPINEDEELGKSKIFWELIEQGENAHKAK